MPHRISQICVCVCVGELFLGHFIYWGLEIGINGQVSCPLEGQVMDILKGFSEGLQ